MTSFFAKNLKHLRKVKAENQASIALLINKGQTTVGNWETGLSQPNIEELLIITNFFGVSIDDIISKDLSKTDNYAKQQADRNISAEPEISYGRKNNVVDLDSTAAAGMAKFLNETDRYKNYPSLYLPWLGTDNYIRVEINGDSMYPTIKDGDKAIAIQIEDTEQIREGYIYLLLDRDEGLVCKRIYKCGTECLELVSDNEIYKPYKRTIDDVLAIFRIQEVHSTDFRPYMTDIKRDLTDLRNEMTAIRSMINRK